MIETPIEIPLIDRSKEELVAIVGRLKENLSWYVKERNRLIELGDGEPSSAPPDNELLNVFAEVMEMAPVRHTLGLNHAYESGCTCLRCRADNAIEKTTDWRSGAAQEVSPPSPRTETERMFAESNIKMYAELEKAEGDTRELKAATKELLNSDGHAMNCAFGGCSCGSVERYKVARTELWRLLGEPTKE